MHGPHCSHSSLSSRQCSFSDEPIDIDETLLSFQLNSSTGYKCYSIHHVSNEIIKFDREHQTKLYSFQSSGSASNCSLCRLWELPAILYGLYGVNKNQSFTKHPLRWFNSLSWKWMETLVIDVHLYESTNHIHVKTRGMCKMKSMITQRATNVELTSTWCPQLTTTAHHT